MKKYLNLIIPFITVVLCSLFVFTTLDFKVADFFQRTLKSTPHNKNVLMINVDDKSVEGIGNFPFSRDVYADVNYNLKELGAEAVVYDLSFLDKSPAKVDESYVNEKLPGYISSEFEKIDDAIAYVADGFETGSITSEEAQDVYDYLTQTTADAQDSIGASVSYVIRDIDEILANSIEFFGNSYLTLTMNDDAIPTEEENEYIANNVALKNINTEKDRRTPRDKGVEPAILHLLKRAKSAGFVNAPVDKDGYLRRLDLVYRYKSNYYGQLAFVPVLNHFGNPEVEVTNKHIILKDCKLDDGSVKDIKIPRDEYGSVLIKYPKCLYDDYNGISLVDIYRLTSNEATIYETVSNLNDSGFFDLWEEDNPYDMYSNAAYIKSELSESGENEDMGITMEQYIYYRNQFYKSIENYLNGSAQQDLLDAYGDDEEFAEIINETFADFKAQFTPAITLRSSVQKKVQNAICIIGTTATSTTDFGLIQYEDHYPNPGVHYTMANMLLSQDFVDDSPIWISIVIALVLCLGYCLVTQKLNSTGKQIVIGVAGLIVSTGILLVIYIFTRTYIGVVIPFTSLFITFIVTSVIGFLTSSHQKRFIQNAFSQCLSPDVVKEIVDNPDSFKLGGQTVDMTAIFTDIQKFSGFSELLTAGQLVALLNFYLTQMSDIIMEQRGTVDKYEGDAIVAFVGAPVKTKEHAALACRAAVNMKKAEVEMNKYIQEIAANPKPEDMDEETYNAFCIMVKNNKTIFTRIGLNSGEIVAGYMGSKNKKNYTMMGNNVNLASRLEGVNKQYRTGGILMSAATRNGLDENFIVRSLDRVQVVNVVTPIRLYELVALKEDADEKLMKYVEIWEKCMKVFEAGEYAKALEGFKKLSEVKPDDNVAKYYIELIEKFFIKGTYPTENDDFGVAYNPENPADMNEEWKGTPFEIKGTFKLLQK